VNTCKTSTAIWAITPNGAKLAEKIVSKVSDTDVYLSEKLQVFDFDRMISFGDLAIELSRRFHLYQHHIFIMATGIVVRLLGPHIRHKTQDPAVVVIDELGQWVISLLSGHLGGANRFAKEIAVTIGAQPVITTATDLNDVPAIDVIAKETDLQIENPAAIKIVNMAFLTGSGVVCHDPMGRIKDRIPESLLLNDSKSFDSNSASVLHSLFQDVAGVFVDDIVVDLQDHVLILRPKSLTAGIGCNRNTSLEEIKSLLLNTLQEHSLSLNSLDSIATINIKSDEPGLLGLATHLNLPLEFFDRDQLNRIEDIVTPSTIVEKHIGVKSVCEASAILAAEKGTLIVPKHSTKNVTVAIARKPYIS